MDALSQWEAVEGFVRQTMQGEPSALDARYSLNENADSVFAKAVDAVANGGSVSGYVKVGTTPDVLKMLGLPDVGVTIHGSTFSKVMMGKHHVAPEVLKQLPAQINNPVAVMKSAPQATQQGYVVLTELVEENNGKKEPVISALHLKQEANGLEIINIASVYGKNLRGLQAMLNRDLIYWNNKKGTGFVDTFGLQLPAYVSQTQSAKGSAFGLQLPAYAADLSGRNIKTESDLAQYRNGETVANPQQQAAGQGEVASEAAAKQRAEQQKAAMRDYVNGALGDLAQYVEVVNSRDVFAGAELKAVRDGGVEGMFYRGKQYLFADMASPERAAWVAWHELGHRGFSNAEFAAHRNLLRRVGKNATIRQMADFIMAERKGNLHDAAAENYNVAVEEALVELYAAQQTGNWAAIEQRYGVQTKGMRGEIRGWLAQMAARLKQAYAKLFGREAASNDEVMGLVGKIHQANKRMAKGQGEVASAENADNANHESRHSLNENAGSDFAQAVDAVANGEMPSGAKIVMGTTPDVLKMLGIENGNVVITARTLRKDMVGKHNVSAEAMKQLPRQLNDPIAVVRSRPDSSNPDAYLVLTELSEIQNGKALPVIAALNFVKNKDGDFELMEIASAYGRKNVKVAKDLLYQPYYWNTTKGSRFLENFSLSSENSGLLSELRTSFASKGYLLGRNIKTESDLRQYQNGEMRFSRRKIRDVDEVRDFARTGKLQDDAGFWARLRSGELLEETRDNLLRDFADNLIDVKRKVEDWEIGGAEQANLIGAMYRASGVRDAQNELIHREYLQPLYRLLAQMTKRSKGLSVLEVKKLAGYWLTARYAPTLNKRFLAQHQQAVDDAQDAYNQDPSSKNYDALNRAQRELAARERAVRGLDKGKVAGGLSDPVAAELMANIEKLLRVGDLERVGSLVSGALSHTLKLDLESGRITQAQYDEYRLNADYVPMTGDPLADLADDVITGSSGINQGRDHQAKGRSSVADDGIDAAMGAIAKATANYGWADFKNQLNDVYENALADLRNRGLSNADALAQVKQSFGMERRAILI